MSPPLIYFIRHGQTDWNAEARLQGQSDIDLNAVGRAQADANGAKLAALIEAPSDFDFVASPMRRTRETMERIRAAMKLAPRDYSTDPRLVEVHFGDWQGFTYAELEDRYPGFAARRDGNKWDIVPPGQSAESYAMMAKRVGAWLGDLRRPTIVVAHGGVARILFRICGEMDGETAVHTGVPQDKILRIEGARLTWL